MHDVRTLDQQPIQGYNVNLIRTTMRQMRHNIFVDVYNSRAAAAAAAAPAAPAARAAAAPAAVAPVVDAAGTDFLGVWKFCSSNAWVEGSMNCRWSCSWQCRHYMCWDDRR